MNAAANKTVPKKKVAAKKIAAKPLPKKKPVKKKIGVTATNSKKSKKDNNPYQWKDHTGDFQNPNSEKPFLEHAGVQRNATHVNTPIEAFKLFVTDEIAQQIVTESNRYHDQMSDPREKWIPITAGDLYAFLGVTIAMGVVRLPEIEHYWRKDGICNMPWFSSVMSVKRYKEILRYLHLTDNNNVPDKNAPNYKLLKLGGLDRKLCDIFPSIYVPRQELSVDEQMVGTKCRISFIQYMPKKPEKFGLKIWSLCEARTGYCLQFQVYTGKENVQEKGLTHRVVTDLLKDRYYHKNHHVYFDNFFTTIPLMNDLADNSTYSCGTIRSDRGKFPLSFKDAKLERGESVFVSTGNHLAVHWKDKRDVFVTSTIHGNGVENVQRRGEVAEITKPTMVCQYNQYMNGVDRCDQYISTYSMQRKTLKWWKKLFFRLIELSIVNSMIVFYKLLPDQLPKSRVHKSYRLRLVNDLVQPLLDECNSHTSGRTKRPGNGADRLKGKHFPSSKHPIRKCCAVCAYVRRANGTQSRKKTSCYCSKCDKFICKKCFEKFHTKSNAK